MINECCEMSRLPEKSGGVAVVRIAPVPTGGLVFKAHNLCVSLNSRLESNKEEERVQAANGQRGAAGMGQRRDIHTGAPRL